MALTAKEQQATEPRDQRSLDEIRQQRLSELRTKKLTPDDIAAVRAAINRNRAVYEALRDR